MSAPAKQEDESYRIVLDSQGTDPSLSLCFVTSSLLSLSLLLMDLLPSIFSRSFVCFLIQNFRL